MCMSSSRLAALLDTLSQSTLSLVEARAVQRRSESSPDVKYINGAAFTTLQRAAGMLHAFGRPMYCILRNSTWSFYNIWQLHLACTSWAATVPLRIRLSECM
jgi:hypothetical protein